MGEAENSWGPWKRYLALLESGQYLDQSCSAIGKVDYGNQQTEEMALRSMLATLQYVGLSHVIQALRQYAVKLEWTSEQRMHLAKNLVSTCSPNMTLFSRKVLMDLLTQDAIVGDEIPLFSKFSAFPLLWREQGDGPAMLRREAELSARLFRNLCSWGGELNDLRLMPTLTHSSVVVSYLISQMLGQEYSYDLQSKELVARTNPDAIQVFCPDHLCRKISHREFEKVFPRSLGQVGLERDLHALYCQHLKDAVISRHSSNLDLDQWLVKSSIDEERIMSALMVSHFTGVPDLLVRTGDMGQTMDWLSKGVLESFDKWALQAISGFALQPEFEESMTLDVVVEQVQKDPKIPLQMDLILNWGEMDKVVSKEGKLTMVTSLTIPARLGQWIANRHLERPPFQNFSQQEVRNRLLDYVKEQIKSWDEKFLTKPWQGDLDAKIAEVLEKELVRLPWLDWDFENQKNLEIPVVFRFGPQSLKFLRYDFLKNRGQAEIKN